MSEPKSFVTSILEGLVKDQGNEIEQLKAKLEAAEKEIERLKKFHTSQGPIDVDAIEGDLKALHKEIERLSGVAQREIQRMQEAFLGEQSAVLEAIRNQLTRERAINAVLIEALVEASEWANMDDVNGYAGEVCANALTKAKEMRDGE